MTMLVTLASRTSMSSGISSGSMRTGELGIKDKKRVGEMFQRTRSSSRGPGLHAQHLHGDSQLPVTPARGDSVPSSVLLRHQACICCTDIHVGRILVHIK